MFRRRLLLVDGSGFALAFATSGFLYVLKYGLGLRPRPLAALRLARPTGVGFDFCRGEGW
jgi:hypothetical protein